MNIFSREFWKERDIELYIGKLLRYGVVTASIITTIGGIIYITQNYYTVPNFSTFVGTESYLRHISTILQNAFMLDGLAIIQLGVVVLIATPILRVVFSAVAFAIEKDYLYVAITLIVLFIILGNMLLGLA